MSTASNDERHHFAASQKWRHEQTVGPTTSSLAKQRVSTAELCHQWTRDIVKPANILEPEQGDGKQGRCVGINIQKVHFIQQEARRQGKRVYRVALWRVMRMFKIPDVDLLEQIYEGATVRLAPNDEESASITFTVTQV